MSRSKVFVRHARDHRRYEVVVKPEGENYEVVASHFAYNAATEDNKDSQMQVANIYAAGVRFGLNYRRTIHGK